jgi:hypothetical protein
MEVGHTLLEALTTGLVNTWSAAVRQAHPEEANKTNTPTCKLLACKSLGNVSASLHEPSNVSAIASCVAGHRGTWAAMVPGLLPASNLPGAFQRYVVWNKHMHVSIPVHFPS